MSKEYYSDFTNQKYSRTEFIRLLTRRTKKDLRNNFPLDMKINYCLYENGILTQLATLLLGKIFENRLNLIIIPKNEALIENSVLLDDSYLEKYVAKKTQVFFKNENLNNLKDVGIPILRTITYTELNQLKEVFEISGDLEKETLEFVEKLNNEYSQTKTSFLKSFNHINKLLSEK